MTLELFWLATIFLTMVLGFVCGHKYKSPASEKDFFGHLNHEVRHRVMLGRNISQMIDMKGLSKADRDFVKKAEAALAEVGPVMERLEMKFSRGV